MSTTDKQIFQVLEQQRQETAQALHDGVAQTALQLGLQAGICRKLLERNNQEMLTTELALLEERIQKTSQQVRQLIQDLRLPVLDDDATLADHIQYHIAIHAERGGAGIKIDSMPDLSLSAKRLMPISRTIQSLFATIREHNHTRPLALKGTKQANQLILQLTPDNADNDADIANQNLQEPLFNSSISLINLRLSVEAANGKLHADPDGNQLAIALPV